MADQKYWTPTRGYLEGGAPKPAAAPEAQDVAPAAETAAPKTAAPEPAAKKASAEEEAPKKTTEKTPAEPSFDPERDSITTMSVSSMSPSRFVLASKSGQTCLGATAGPALMELGGRLTVIGVAAQGAGSCWTAASATPSSATVGSEHRSQAEAADRYRAEMSGSLANACWTDSPRPTRVSKAELIRSSLLATVSDGSVSRPSGKPIAETLVSSRLKSRILLRESSLMPPFRFDRLL